MPWLLTLLAVPAALLLALATLWIIGETMTLVRDERKGIPLDVRELGVESVAV